MTELGVASPNAPPILDISSLITMTPAEVAKIDIAKSGHSVQNTIRKYQNLTKQAGSGRKIYLLNRANTEYKHDSFGGNWAEESNSLITTYNDMYQNTPLVIKFNDNSDNNTTVNNVSQDSGPDFVVDLGGGSGTIYEKNNGKFTIFKGNEGNSKIKTKMNEYLDNSDIRGGLFRNTTKITPKQKNNYFSNWKNAK